MDAAISLKSASFRRDNDPARLGIIADSESSALPAAHGGLPLLPWLLALLLTVVNLAKPLAIDDPAYLIFARHLRQQPTDPYGFSMLWGEHFRPAIEILMPPVVPYWLAGGLAVVGEQPTLMKVWMFPFAALLAWSIAALAARFATALAPATTLAIVASPLLLPMLNLMLDVPALALQLTALELALRALERSSWRGALGAGIVGGLAMQTKYTAFAVVPLLAWAGYCAGRFRWGLGSASIALGVFVSWEVALLVQAGQSHFLYHLTHPANAGGSWLAAKSQLFAPLLAFLGGLMPCVLWWAALANRRDDRRKVCDCRGEGRDGRSWFRDGRSWFRERRGWIASIAMTGLGLSALVLLPAEAQIFARSPTGAERWTLPNVVFAVWGGMFAIAVGKALLALLLRRDGTPRHGPSTATAWLLAGWWLIEIGGYFALSPFPAARRVLGVAVVSALLVACWASRRWRTSLQWEWTVSGILSLTVALGIAWADRQEAFVEVRLVHEAVATVEALARTESRTEPETSPRTEPRTGPMIEPIIESTTGWAEPRTVWFVGLWGWSYYAERAGFRPWDVGRSPLRPGDWVLVPWGDRPSKPTFDTSSADWQPLAEVRLTDLPRLQLVPQWYGGKMPFRRRGDEAIGFTLYRVRSSRH